MTSAPPLAPPLARPYSAAMGIDVHLSDYDWNAALAALAWQVDLGVSEAISETPIDRYELPERQETVVKKTPAAVVVAEGPKEDPAHLATRAATACQNLTQLRAALDGFEHCDLRHGARNLVFADGNPSAHLMLVGEAPDRDEDREGRPFVGQAGQLLDRMLAAIGRARSSDDPAAAAYLTKVIPWRPASTHEPTEEEIAMLAPFLLRHIALVKPRVVIAAGNMACRALLGQSGINRLRGHWAEVAGIPVMPMLHPSALLTAPAAKRDAWADLLAVEARLAAP